jgi:hypothetical protein
LVFVCCGAQLGHSAGDIWIEFAVGFVGCWAVEEQETECFAAVVYGCSEEAC